MEQSGTIGRPRLEGHGSDGTPSGGWIAGTPSAAVNADGRLDVFVLGGGNSVFHNYQTSPGGGWSGWIYLGGGNIATPPTVTRNADGRLQLFAIGTDGAMWTAYQQIPGDLWSALGSIWSSIPSVAENADGRLELFAIGTDTALWHIWQASPGGAWSGWSSLGGGLASAPAAAVNDDGRVEVFVQGSDGNGWHIWQNSPGGGWSGWSSLGGQISGALSVGLDAAASLETFALENGVYAYVEYQSNGWAGWNALQGGITAAPAIAMNFDGRLEIFGIGVNGSVWHDWQLSPAGAWSGFYSLAAASNWWDTNGPDLPFFLTDAQNASNYSASYENCYQNVPWWTAANAWPCGARVNISFTGYNRRSLADLSDAIHNWNNALLSYYTPINGQQMVPVQLFVSSGGPQAAQVYRVDDDSIPGSDPGTYGRAQNTNQTPDVNFRLLRLDIQIIRGMTYGATLKNTLAHELGHTFGLFDCKRCATSGGGGPTVMDSFEYPPGGHGWDYVGKNFTEGLPGPTQCDLQVIDSHLPDYRQCGMVESSPPSDVPSCTDGSAVGFMDMGQTSTYTCDGLICDGCNSACSNFSPQQCGGDNGGCENCNGTWCSNMCGNICMDSLTCQNGSAIQCSGGEPYCSESPIIIDAFGEGFHLTSLNAGVQFKVLPKDGLSQMSWTDQQFRNGWLALDRNENGKIDDFTELFGDMTPQPRGDDPNGYLALAIFDDPMNGGNGNGEIDPGDSIYDRLVLWIDANHNGISEPQEMHSLRDMGIFRIDLKYTLSRYVDANGNQFRYRAKIWDQAGAPHNTCYDVLIQVQPPQLSSGGH